MSETFGYTHAGTSSLVLDNTIGGLLATCSEIGTGTSITVKLKCTTVAKKAKCCLYDSAGNKITNGETEEKTIEVADFTEITFDFLTPPTLAAQDYIIAMWGEAGDGYVGNPYEAVGSGGNRKFKGTTYDGWPASVAFSSGATRNQWGYVTYEPAGATAQAVGDGSITPTGALTTAAKYIEAMGDGSIAPTGALSTVAKWFETTGEGSITPTGALTKLIKKLVGSGSITPTGALTSYLWRKHTWFFRMLQRK